MRRIALFLPNWIGDVVMATPALRAARRHFADAEVLAVGRPYVLDTLGGCPWLDRVIPFGKGDTLSVARQLRRARVDAAVLFPNSFRSALAALLGGCRRRVGFARYGRTPLLTDRLHHKRANGRWVPTPVIDDYNRLVAPLGVPDPGRVMELHTTPAGEAAADAAWGRLGLAGASVVGLNPGAAFGAAKHWPAASFAELARRLAGRGRRVVVLCGPAERDLARSIAREADHPAVCSTADETPSLGLTKAIVRRLDLLVTTDSGPRHFAAAFGRPVVTLFGPTYIGWTETFFDRAIHLQKEVSCGPCQLRVCPTDHACMNTLSPAEVLAACDRLLSGEVRRAG